MSLKKKISKNVFDALPGDLQKEYKLDTATGDYVLDVEGEEDIEGLKKKNAELLAEKKAAKEAKEKADREAEEAKTEAAKKSGDIAALEKSYQDKIAGLTSTTQAELAGLKNTITELTVGSTATAIAAELAVQGSSSVLLPHIKSRLSVEMSEGKALIRVLDQSGKPSAMSVDELKKEISENKAFAPLIAASKASGGGVKNNGGGGAPASGNPGGTRDERTKYFESKFNFDNLEA